MNDAAMPIPVGESLEHYESDVRAVRGAYGKIKFNRSYSADDVTWRQLVSLWRAACRSVGDKFTDANFVELLQRVADILMQFVRNRPKDDPIAQSVSLVQTWRPPDERSLEPLPVDPATSL